MCLPSSCGLSKRAVADLLMDLEAVKTIRLSVCCTDVRSSASCTQQMKSLSNESLNPLVWLHMCCCTWQKITLRAKAYTKRWKLNEQQKDALLLI